MIIFSVALQGLLFGQDSIKKDSVGKYLEETLRLQQAIEKYFHDDSSGYYKETVQVEKGQHAYSYLWPICGMLQANNEIEKLTWQKDLFDKTIKVAKSYYDTAMPAPGYASYITKFGGGDRFYDDNQWIGIAAMDAWFRNGDDLYLNTGKEIYRYMMTGYDTILGGGIYWQENRKNTKNTCSNGPGIILALQLYKATRKKEYLDTALLLYNWVNKYLKAPSGLYYDNIRINNKRISPRQYSYNTGTMLQSNVYLYELTGKKKYLHEAVVIADSSVGNFYGKGKFIDNLWFNAVMLRAYQHLLQYHKDGRYIKAFKICTDHALGNIKNEMGLMGKEKAFDLVQQSGMLEILARLAWLEKNLE